MSSCAGGAQSTFATSGAGAFSQAANIIPVGAGPNDVIVAGGAEPVGITDLLADGHAALAERELASLQAGAELAASLGLLMCSAGLVALMAWVHGRERQDAGEAAVAAP